MRKPFVGLSMKIYKNDYQENREYLTLLEEKIKTRSNIDVVYLPSVALLHTLASEFNLNFGIQNIGLEPNGAHTGEVSIEVFDNFKNVKYIELGHAERKSIYKETNDMISKKIDLSIKLNKNVMVCIGEENQILNDSELTKFFVDEVKSLLGNIESKDFNKVILAYEPVWAIGKEKSASPGYIHNSHKLLRKSIEKLFGSKAASEVRIIYGGSVSKSTVSAICDNEHVDGVFVGRFGHKIENFIEIIDQVEGIKYG